MPAKSVAQRRFLAMCQHHPEHARGQCPDMKPKQFHDFTATPEAGLPAKVEAEPPPLPAVKPRNSYRRRG